MAVLPSYRNQSIDLDSKSIDWFLHEGNTGNQWVNEYIRRNIIMSVLRKASFYSVEIWWFTKINNVKEHQEGKLIQTLIFSKLPSADEVLRGRNAVYIMELFLHQKT